jgi:uncharacterized alkaline shock family protein YloU
MTDFSTDGRPAPNGPAPYPSRPEEQHTTATDPGAARPPAGLGGPGTPVGSSGTGLDPSGAPRPAARPPEAAGGGLGGAPSSLPRPAPGPQAAPAPSASGPAPGVEVKGRISIADEVVEKIAALAAMQVPGVADLGGDFARVLESVRERVGIGAKRGDQGVKADVKGQDVSISVTIMVEFGYVVMEVARQVQANVAVQTNRMLGLRVVEVNVTVDDVRTAPPPRPEDHANGA